MSEIGDFFSPKQIEAINNSDAPINVWEGAVSSGKTYSSLWRWYKECRDGPPGPFCMLSKTYDTFKRNILPELHKILGPHVRYFAGKREMTVKGRQIHIIGCSDERAEQKIRGPTFAGAYVDECTLIPQSAFSMLLSRLRVPNAKLFCTTNPDAPTHWFKEQFLNGNPDVKSWKFLMQDNPNLTEDYKAFIKRQYRGMWYKRFVEGEWVQAEGAIYDAFNEVEHVIDFPRSMAQQYIVGIDYGTRNACAFVLIGINKDEYPNVWVEKEYYFDSKKQQHQKTDGEYCDDLKEFVRGKPISAFYIDPSALSFKVELQREGFQHVFDAKNEVIDGIRHVGTALWSGTLKVCRGCTHLIQEFHSYVWDEKGKKLGTDKPLKENDHALDALRYAVFTHFFQKPTQTLKGQDIDRLYNETRGVGQELPRFFQQPNDQMGSSGLGGMF